MQKSALLSTESVSLEMEHIPAAQTPLYLTPRVLVLSARLSLLCHTSFASTLPIPFCTTRTSGCLRRKRRISTSPPASSLVLAETTRRSMIRYKSLPPFDLFHRIVAFDPFFRCFYALALYDDGWLRVQANAPAASAPQR